MSGTMSTCCQSSLTDVASAFCPPQLCEYAALDCQDGISIAIQAILDLAQPQGSTADDIFTRGLSLCPQVALARSDIDDALSLGARRGIFFRAYAAVGATPTYMVNARMTIFNYKNRKYNRLPCMTNSYWRKT